MQVNFGPLEVKLSLCAFIVIGALPSAAAAYVIAKTDLPEVIRAYKSSAIIEVSSDTDPDVVANKINQILEKNNLSPVELRPISHEDLLQHISDHQGADNLMKLKRELSLARTAFLSLKARSLVSALDLRKIKPQVMALINSLALIADNYSIEALEVDYEKIKRLNKYERIHFLEDIFDSNLVSFLLQSQETDIVTSILPGEFSRNSFEDLENFIVNHDKDSSIKLMHKMNRLNLSDGKK